MNFQMDEMDRVVFVQQNLSFTIEKFKIQQQVFKYKSKRALLPPKTFKRKRASKIRMTNKKVEPRIDFKTSA